MDEFWVQIGNYGFPILVSIYLLMRMEARLEQLCRVINDLREAIITQRTG